MRRRRAAEETGTVASSWKLRNRVGVRPRSGVQAPCRGLDVIMPAWGCECSRSEPVIHASVTTRRRRMASRCLASVGAA